MSINRASLLASGLGLIISTVAFSSGAMPPQVMTGYNAFRPYPTHGAQHCVNEYWGAALNTCAGNPQPYIIFELPFDVSGGGYGVFTYGLSNGGSGSFTCQAVAISPNTLAGSWGSTATLTGAVGQGEWSALTIPAGWSLRLQCNNVPSGRGIQSVRVEASQG